jgi:hypothetical protein
LNNGEATGWLPVSDLETGFNENKLPATAILAGKTITLYLDNEQEIKYTFEDESHLTCEMLKRPETGIAYPETYEAIQVAPNRLFLDYVKNEEPGNSVTMILDLKKKTAMVVQSTVPDRENADSSFLKRMSRGLNLSPMKVEIHEAQINQHWTNQEKPLFPRTDDLIGKIIRYTYSRQHIYEHYYLNSRFYAWQCLKGPEKGTADADYCDYFKVAPGVYLFIWREKIVPTVGIAVINLKEMRSTGKIFGLDIPSGRPVNFTMGAYARLVAQVQPFL